LSSSDLLEEIFGPMILTISMCLCDFFFYTLFFFPGLQQNDSFFCEIESPPFSILDFADPLSSWRFPFVCCQCDHSEDFFLCLLFLAESRNNSPPSFFIPPSDWPRPCYQHDVCISGEHFFSEPHFEITPSQFFRNRIVLPFTRQSALPTLFNRFDSFLRESSVNPPFHNPWSCVFFFFFTEHPPPWKNGGPLWMFHRGR